MLLLVWMPKLKKGFERKKLFFCDIIFYFMNKGIIKLHFLYLKVFKIKSFPGIYQQDVDA